MLTSEDIKNLTDYQKESFKDVFATKEDIERLQTNFSSLQSSIDAIALDKKNNNDKILGLEHRMKTSEDFLDKAAPKLNIQFKH